MPKLVRMVAYANDLMLVATERNRMELKEAGSSRGLDEGTGSEPGSAQDGGSDPGRVQLTEGCADKSRRHQDTERRENKISRTTLSRNMTFNANIEDCVSTADKYLIALEGILPRAGGARKKGRRMLCTVAYSKLLYAAPV